jgi:hypothetical protein
LCPFDGHLKAGWDKKEPLTISFDDALLSAEFALGTLGIRDQRPLHRCIGTKGNLVGVVLVAAGSAGEFHRVWAKGDVR